MKKLLKLTVAVLAGLTAVGASAQDVKAGEQKIAMCIGCHGIPGYQATFPEVHKVPMIAGQNAKYIAAALTAYAKGERKHPTMRGIAQTLSEKDIADVSAFYEQQAQAPAAGDAPAAPAAVAELLNKGACASCHGANFSKPIDGAYPKLAGQVKQFSHAELKAIAKYLSSLGGELRTVPQSKMR